MHKSAIILMSPSRVFTNIVKHNQRTAVVSKLRSRLKIIRWSDVLTFVRTQQQQKSQHYTQKKYDNNVYFTFPSACGEISGTESHMACENIECVCSSLSQNAGRFVATESSECVLAQHSQQLLG